LTSHSYSYSFAFWRHALRLLDFGVAGNKNSNNVDDDCLLLSFAFLLLLTFVLVVVLVLRLLLLLLLFLLHGSDDHNKHPGIIGLDDDEEEVFEVLLVQPTRCTLLGSIE